MKKFKFFLPMLIIGILIFNIYEKREEYINKKEELLNLNKKLENLNQDFQNIQIKDTVKRDGEIEKIKVSETDFLKAIYYFSSYAHLKLIDKSSSIIKESDEFYERVYVVFKFTGSLVDFYEFMQYLFYSDIYIDTQESYLKLDSKYFEISIGYYRERL